MREENKRGIYRGVYVSKLGGEAELLVVVALTLS
jgi:phage-related protein